MLWWLLQNAATAGVLAGVVGLACWLGRPRPAIKHALWLLVVLKLLSPIWLEWPWPMPEVPSPTVKVAAEPPPVAVAVAMPTPPLAAPPVVKGAATVPQQPMPTAVVPSPMPSPPLKAIPPPSPAVTLWQPELIGSLLVILWGIGCLIVGLVQMVRMLRLWRRSQRGEPAPEWLRELIAVQARTLGVRPPAIMVVPGVGSPFLACFGRPTLVVPQALLSRLPSESWPSIVVHELAHLHRRDHWVVWIELAATCLWWWFPVFWFVRRQLRFNAEMACDAWVVATLPDGRRAYAEALLDVSQLSGSAEPLPALALGGGARALFQRRLMMILRDRVPARLPLLGLLIVGLLAVIVLPGWLPGQKPASEMLKPLPLEEALKKARVDGKYEMLLAQFKDEAGAEENGAFKDLGMRTTTELGKQKNLPRGHWVYVYPNYYIFRDLSATPKPNRNWGTEQVLGEPNTTEAGDIVTAWASRDPDGTDEWIVLEYPEAVMPRAVMVHETFNPGALVRVTAFKLDGEEVEVWKGTDPTSTDEAKGVSVVPFKVDFKTNRVKIYLASTQVPGWNEIDAVGLKDDKGKVQWASNANASSTYAQQQAAVAPPAVNINAMMNEQRIRKLEDEVKQLKMVIEEMKKKMDKDK